MAVAVLVIVVGLIVGVAIELAISKRHSMRDRPAPIDPGTVVPAPPQPPQPRFVDDGEGFTILGPIDYDELPPTRGESDGETGGEPDGWSSEGSTN